MPKSGVYDHLSTKLDRKISLGLVGAEKGLGGPAPVIAEEYKEALALALRQAGWYTADATPAYTLNAKMIKIDQPFIGFNFTVKATAQYSLVRVKGGDVVYEETLTLPCTVMFAEAFDGIIRLRRATACSVGENITHLLNVLSQEKL